MLVAGGVVAAMAAGPLALAWLAGRWGGCCVNTWALSRGTLGPVVLLSGLLGYHATRALGSAFGWGRGAGLGLWPHAAYAAAVLALWPPTEVAVWAAVPLAVLALALRVAGRAVQPLAVVLAALVVSSFTAAQRLGGEGAPSDWLYVRDTPPTRECAPSPPLDDLLATGLTGRALWEAPRLFHGFFGRDAVLIERFLQAGDAPDICGPGGLSPLALAAGLGRTPVVEALLAHGADVDYGGALDVGSPLMQALAMGRWRVAQRLLAHGANARAVGPAGITALHELALAGSHTAEPSLRQAVARELTARGVKVDARTKEGTTPLALAALAGDADGVALLLDLGADPALRGGKAHMTAEERALKAGHAAVAELLARHAPRPGATKR